MTIAQGPEMMRQRRNRDAGVVLGEDWVSPEAAQDAELRHDRRRRSLISVNRSPLARKIITFNLVAMLVMVSGVLFLNPFRDSLVAQRERAIVSEALLVADVIEASFPAEGPVDLLGPEGAGAREALAHVQTLGETDLFVFAPGPTLVTSSFDLPPRVPLNIDAPQRAQRATVISNFLNAVWTGISRILAPGAEEDIKLDTQALARSLAEPALHGQTAYDTLRDSAEHTIFTVSTPIHHHGQVVGVLAMTSVAGEIDALVRAEREQVLEMFIIAILVSVGLSLVLASTIANPLSDLAAAAELGRDKNARKMSPSRIRIPDLTARPDEIGRLSGAMRGMVTALYDRIDANEQFAADVAHEIKNPLASLRSAVGTMRVAKREDQREKLLEVIEHDVRRLDRLVSDISNASRLDSELVRDEEEEFDLLKTLGNINEYLSQQAEERGIDYITDLPRDPIRITGLEGRLAQVFVNLITNAVSFCEEGDAVRVWVRRRENRVLIVVEDTGPGIPEQALTKIFKRFYSERPAGQFGEHSGLGLAISKQIVEAHGGVIWAENIRPTEADITSEPLGARFVVGLPV